MNRLLTPPTSANCEIDDDEQLFVSAGRLNESFDYKISNSNNYSTQETPSYDNCKTDVINVVDTAIDTDDDDEFEQDIINETVTETDNEHEDIKDNLEELESILNCCKIVTLQDNAISYFAGFSVSALRKRFQDCKECLLTLVDSSKQIKFGHQLLTHFKAYPTKDDSGDIFSTGNLTVVTEEYRKVCELQLNALAERYAYVRSDYGQIEKLEKYIIQKTNEKYPTWFQTACKKHRLFLLRKLVVSRVSRGLKWESIDKRQTKKRSRKPLKSNDPRLKKHCHE